MPPKKKAPKAAKKKDVGPKAPIGRPRKNLGTRVSDLPLVSTLKPTSRRVNIDSLAMNRARLAYKRDYGKTLDERQSRALIDAMSTTKRGPIGTAVVGTFKGKEVELGKKIGDMTEASGFFNYYKQALKAAKKNPGQTVVVKKKKDGTLKFEIPGIPEATTGTLSATSVPAPSAESVASVAELRSAADQLLAKNVKLTELINSGTLSADALVDARKKLKANTADLNSIAMGIATSVSPMDDRDLLIQERSRERLRYHDGNLPQAERDAAAARVRQITRQLTNFDRAQPTRTINADEADIMAAVLGEPEDEEILLVRPTRTIRRDDPGPSRPATATATAALTAALADPAVSAIVEQVQENAPAIVEQVQENAPVKRAPPVRDKANIQKKVKADYIKKGREAAAALLARVREDRKALENAPGRTREQIAADEAAEEADLTARLNRLRDPGDPGPAANTLEAHAARLDPDGRLREIVRLADLAQQRGPLPPPVAVSTSRRPSRQDVAQAAETYILTQLPSRRTAEEILYSRVLAAERQRAAEEAANALLQPLREPGTEEEDEDTRQRINARIRQRQIEEQAAELGAARARLDAANRAIASRESSRRNREIADAIVAQSNIPRTFGTVYNDIEGDPSIPIPGYRRNISSDQQERARIAQAATAAREAVLDQQALDEYNQMDAARRAARAQEAAYAILQPGTPVQSDSRYATAPGSAYATAPASVSGYATPMTEEQIRQARRHQSAAVTRMSRSFSELEAGPRREGPNQDLADLMDARNAVVAAREEVARQQAENERLYQQREKDKELLYLQNKALLEVETQRRIAEQAALELGEPVPVQRNIPTTTADAFSQGWATAFPSANIPVPPPQPPRPTGRPPKRSRNITDAELAAALAKGLKPTQGISSRELYATPREGGPPGLPPSVRSLPSAKDLQEATKRLKKPKPHVESGPLDVLLAPAVEPVNVPSTVNSEMAERLRKKFEGAQGKKDDDPWDDDVPALVQGALTNLGVDPEIAKDEEFARAMEKKLSGTGLASKKFLKAVIKRARKTVKGGAMGGRMNDDRTDFRVLMDAMKNIRTGSGYFDGYKSLTYNIHGTPDDNKKDLAAAKAAYAAKGGRRCSGGSIVLSGVPTPMTGGSDWTLQAVTFPDTDWKSSSSLRWLRSSGIKPMKKADKQGTLFRYRIEDPKKFTDYYTSDLMSRGRKIHLVYGK